MTSTLSPTGYNIPQRKRMHSPEVPPCQLVLTRAHARLAHLARLARLARMHRRPHRGARLRAPMAHALLSVALLHLGPHVVSDGLEVLPERLGDVALEESHWHPQARRELHAIGQAHRRGAGRRTARQRLQPPYALRDR